ncbi:MAG: NAD(P)H-dependent flavin oxidoreductase [Candidatus Helarchaeota archaeon]
MTIKIETSFTKVAKIEHPMIMGAFAGLGRAEFAAPFSEAGGLGIITAHNFRNVKKFKAELEKMQSLTSRPFGINFSLNPPIEHFARLMNEDNFLPYVEAAIDFGIKIMTTSAYKSEKIGTRLHESGCIWIHKCATIEHAISADKHGADFVVIVGLEGTGFKNPLQNTTLINMTVAKKILKNAKLIAAGGIADARGFLSALMMGASAVCFGTLLMATTECPISEKFKMEKLVKIKGYDDTEFYKRVFHFSLKDSPVPSMSVALIDDIIPIKERIERIMEDSEKILNEWGIKKEIIKLAY